MQSEETPTAVDQESLTVADLEDSEFGSFVSISNINPNPDTEQSTALPQVNDSSIKSEHSEVLNQTDDLSLPQEQSISGVHSDMEKADTTDGISTIVVDYPSLTEVPSDSPVVVVESGHALPPELGNNTVDGYNPSLSPLKGGRKASKSPVVDKLSLKKSVTKTGTTKEKTGKKVSKKESQKKAKKNRSKTENIDDNQSEISYQPDTDLSRSKASKKVNGKLPTCNYITLLLLSPFSFGCSLCSSLSRTGTF